MLTFLRVVPARYWANLKKIDDSNLRMDMLGPFVAPMPKLSAQQIEEELFTNLQSLLGSAWACRVLNGVTL